MEYSSFEVVSGHCWIVKGKGSYICAYSLKRRLVVRVEVEVEERSES